LITLYSMATVLAAEVVELTNQRHCVTTLGAAGFDLRDVAIWLPDAQELARELRAQTADQVAEVAR
jgi:hypothetical protein